MFYKGFLRCVELETVSDAVSTSAPDASRRRRATDRTAPSRQRDGTGGIAINHCKGVNIFGAQFPNILLRYILEPYTIV